MEQPTFYAIIPAKVRYSNLKPSAKLLYGEITALSNKYGYCFASNNYFANLYNVTKNTISLWISDLQKAGFITIEIIRNENKQVVKRKLGITKFSDTPVTKNGEDNNTSVNTTSNNNTISLRQKKFESAVSLMDCDVKLKIEFCDYWCEKNPSKTKMRFEMEKTFDIKKRLARWQKNSLKWNTKPTKKSNTKNNLDTWQKARDMLNNMNT